MLRKKHWCSLLHILFGTNSVLQRLWFGLAAMGKKQWLVGVI
jgi:hypothetical protein